MATSFNLPLSPTVGQSATLPSGAQVVWNGSYWAPSVSTPLTTAGDLLIGVAGGSLGRLGIGSNGQVLTVSGGALSWAAPTGGMANPMTAAGDVIIGGTSGAPTRLAAGTNGQVLTLVSGVPTWQAASGGSSGIKFTESETAPSSPSVGDIWLVPSTSTWYQRVTDTGSNAIWVEINSLGPSSGYGTATLNFGAHPGSNEASVTITGQTGISTGKAARAKFAYTTLGSKTANDHRYMSLLVDLICGPITDGVGFTVYATSTEKMTGSYTIQYTWS